MSDQNTSDAYRHMSDSEMDEGPSRTASGYEADTKESFIFKTKSEEAFPPKKRGWFNKEKREKRRKKEKQRSNNNHSRRNCPDTRNQTSVGRTR
ncbi:hypothetical protein Hanom_Chr08g00702001 [Helianthus anomalus]